MVTGIDQTTGKLVDTDTRSNTSEAIGQLLLWQTSYLDTLNSQLMKLPNSQIYEMNDIRFWKNRLPSLDNGISSWITNFYDQLPHGGRFILESLLQDKFIKDSEGIVKALTITYERYNGYLHNSYLTDIRMSVVRNDKVESRMGTSRRNKELVEIIHTNRDKVFVVSSELAFIIKCLTEEQLFILEQISITLDHKNEVSPNFIPFLQDFSRLAIADQVK